MGLEEASHASTCAKCGATLPAHFVSHVCPVCALAATLGGSLGRMGPYSLEEVLGRGGMGIVYIGLHDLTGRAVAVKVPKLTEENATELRRRFATEAEVLTSLEHPGILPLYEVGEDNGTPYYAMKLADGNLAERLPGLPANPRQAAEYLAAVAEAVHYAHQRGVLHRDLKPQNILLDERSRPLVADFGLARLVDRDTDVTLSEGMLGTPDYVAPEVAAGGPRASTIASDVFSLGAILYHCLTGTAPFHGDTVIETLSRIARSEVVPVRTCNPRVTEDLELICLKCLETESSVRYASAAALATDLRAWLDGRPLQVRPPTWGERGWQFARRNPVISVLSLITALVVLIGAVTTWVSHERALVAERNRADAAERLANERLITQSKIEAEGLIRSGRTGQRERALSLLQQIWAVRPDPEIRSLAIQALTLADFEVFKPSPQGFTMRHEDTIPDDAISANSKRRASVEPGNTKNVLLHDAAGEPILTTRLLHSAIAFSWNPGGDRLLIATADKHLYLWNAGDEAVERRMSSRESATYSMAWHPTREVVACQTQEGLVRIWDIASGRDLVMGYLPFPLDSTIQWSADGRRLVWNDQSVEVRLPAILRVYRPDFFEIRMEDLGTISLSDDGLYAAVVAESGARVWDLAKGEDIAFLKKSADEWLGVRWMKDGLLAGGWNSPLRVVPFERIKGTLAPRAGNYVLDDKGYTLAGVSDDRRWIALLNTELHRFLLRSMDSGGLIELKQADPYWISLSADGSIAATSSFRKSEIKIWNLPSGELRREIPFRVSARLDLSPDGSTLLATTSIQVSELNPGTGQIIRTIESDEEIRQASYSPDGHWIAIATSRSVKLHHRNTGQLAASLTIPSLQAGEHQVSITFSRDGSLLGVQFSSSGFGVWNLTELATELSAIGMGW